MTHSRSKAAFALAVLLCSAMLLAVVPGLAGPGGGNGTVPGHSSSRETEFILSGGEEYIRGQDGAEFGKITLTGKAYLTAPGSSDIVLAGDIDLFDDSVLEINARKCVINGDINLYDRAVLKIARNTEEMLVDGMLQLHDNSTVLVEDTTMTFARRTIMEYGSRFNISASEVHMKRPIRMLADSSFNVLDGADLHWEPYIDLGETEPLIHLQQNARILIDNSTFNVTPPDWPWEEVEPELVGFYNTSYILTDDNSEVHVVNSDYSVTLPGNVVGLYDNVPAGTTLATGYSKWFFIDSTIYGELNYSQYVDFEENGNYTLTDHNWDPGNISSFVEYTRWFWFSSQREGSVTIVGSDITLAEPGQTVFKPTSGTFNVRNSRIHGEVQPETSSKIDIRDTYIEYANTQKWGTDFGTDYALKINDRCQGRITGCELQGNLEIGWSSTNDYLGQSTVRLVLENNHINGSVHVFANSDVTMHKNTIAEENFEVEGNTTLTLKEQDMEHIIGVPGVAHPYLLAINENVTVNMFNSSAEALTTHSANTTFTVNMYGNSTLEWLDLTRFNTTGKVRIEDEAEIERINISDTSRLVMTLFDPDEKDIPSKAENGETYYIAYRKDIRTRLNGRPLDNATVLLELKGSNMALYTNESGELAYEYISKTITSGGVTDIGAQGTFSTEFYGIEATKTVDMSSTGTVVLDITDETPPEISDIDYEPTSFNLKKPVFVTARVEDSDVGSLSDVHISYRVNGGKWRNVTMVETEPGLYKGTIPKHNLVEVEFKVVAVDALGNEQVSGESSYRSGSSERLVTLLVGALIFAALLIALIVRFKNRSTINKYVNDRFSSDKFPNLSKPEEGKK